MPNSTNLLVTQLRYVGHNVPYFRGLGCNDGRPIEEFPFTFKTQIRNNYASFISNEFRHVRQPLVDFMTKGQIFEEQEGIYTEEVYFGHDIMVANTTGTSGTVLRCPKTMADRFRLGIGIWRQRGLVDPLVRPSNLFPWIHAGLTPIKEPWSCDLPDLKSRYEEIRKGRYRWLHCPAYILQRHIEVFQREGWRPALPNLKFIESIGHFLRQEVAVELGGFFGAEVLDNYSLLETWTVAITCRHGVLHVNEHNIHVEIINERDRPVRLGEIGRIVVTSLQERLMPFVRYVTDDFGMFIEKPCGCNLGSKVLALVEGRSGNLIKGALGHVFGDIFFMNELKKISYFDLLYVRIRQVAPREFIVQTNSIRKPLDLIAALKKETELLLGGHVEFRHLIFNDVEIATQERQKPWLFRCEC